MTDQNMPAVPAAGAADEAAMKDWAELLVARARAEGVELTGDGGLLTGLVRQVLQCGLEVEMAERLGYERNAPEGRGTSNSRNGSSPKRVKTDIGEVDLRVPRDRAGTFEPVTVPKHQRRLDGLSGNVISLYAKGPHHRRDPGASLRDLWHRGEPRDDLGRSPTRSSPDMTAWQNRPLDAVYPVLLIDAITVKVRGRPGPLTGPPMSPSGSTWPASETCWACGWAHRAATAAKQWATMLTELRNRGLVDVLIVCCDGLRGLPESIRAAWPDATVQTCVVHMVRNSLRYASRKHWGQITKAMRAIYTSPTVEAAEAHFEAFRDDWAATYPAMIRAWENSWAEFVPFLEFPGRAAPRRQLPTPSRASTPDSEEP